MDKAIEATRYGFAQMGSTNKDSFSDSELQALNISMTTRIDNETVVARWAGIEVNISQPISGNFEEH